MKTFTHGERESRQDIRAGDLVQAIKDGSDLIRLRSGHFRGNTRTVYDFTYAKGDMGIVRSMWKDTGNHHALNIEDAEGKLLYEGANAHNWEIV